MSYHVVLVPDGTAPSVHSFTDLAELLSFLRTVPEADAYGFYFEGQRLHVTPTRPRTLFAGGARHLIDTSEEVEPTPGDGRLGPPDTGLDPDYAALTPDFQEGEGMD